MMPLISPNNPAMLPMICSCSFRRRAQLVSVVSRTQFRRKCFAHNDIRYASLLTICYWASSHKQRTGWFEVPLDFRMPAAG